jgi:predicted GNAT family N-acyltransferase
MDARLVIDPTGDALEAAFALRYRVFVEEQRVPEDLERDGLDDAARHVVLLEGERAIATGRLLIGAEAAKVQRVAVAPERRGEGLGRVIMDALEEVARQGGAPLARLASQAGAVPFYERLGYRAFGDPFMEAGIAHRWMDKPLA